MNIARAEALETRYWLRMVAAVGLLRETQLQSVIQESTELISILVTIVKRTRSQLKETSKRH